MMRIGAICALLIAASPAVSLPAMAQGRTEPAAPGRSAQANPRQPAAAPAPAAPAAPQANAPAQPPAPQPVRTEIVPHDNWTVTCREFADKKRSCSGVLQVVQSQNNQVLFVWLLGKNNDGKVMSVLQTPTGVSIAPGVEVKLGRGPARKAVFVNCEASRCEATLDMDDAFIKDASASDQVEATVYSNTGQGVKFTLPFKGFDKALPAVR